MSTTTLNQSVLKILEEFKAIDIQVLDVSALTSVMETMIVCSGRSSRHVKSLAHHLVQQMKAENHQPLGVEGIETGDWVLVDLGSTVVHIMRPEIREFYEIEKLWRISEPVDQASS